MIPPELRDRYRSARRVVEVGAGTRFDVALAWARLLPEAVVVVTDVDARVLGAPEPLVARVDDLLRPDVGLYEGADVLLMVRPPEELWVPAARLARRVGADLLVKPLGTEEVDLTVEGGRVEVLDGWRRVTFR